MTVSAELAEVGAQRLEVEAERRDRVAVDAEVGGLLHRVEIEPAARGDLDRVGVAAGVGCRLAHLVEQRRRAPRRRGRERNRRRAGRRAAAAASVWPPMWIGGPLGCRGLRERLQRREACELAVVGRLGLAPQLRSTSMYSSVRVPALLERDAERVELFFEPADTDAELDAPADQPVERRELLWRGSPDCAAAG